MKRFGLKNLNKKGKGFTIVEVLVVIVIIAILFTVIFVAVGDIRMKARNTKRESDMGQVNKALQLYQNEEENYPVGNYGNLDVLVPNYIGELPKDPFDSTVDGCDYYYTYSSDGTTYTLTYHTEPTDDCFLYELP